MRFHCKLLQCMVSVQTQLLIIYMQFDAIQLVVLKHFAVFLKAIPLVIRAKDSRRSRQRKRQRLPGSLMKGGIPRNGCLTQWRR